MVKIAFHAEELALLRSPARCGLIAEVHAVISCCDPSDMKESHCVEAITLDGFTLERDFEGDLWTRVSDALEAQFTHEIRDQLLQEAGEEPRWMLPVRRYRKRLSA